MSLACPIGPEGNILEPNASQCQRLWLKNPILSLQDVEILKNTQVNNWKTKIIDITFDFHQDDLESALDRICFEANEAANQSNHQFIVLSDRNVSEGKVYSTVWKFQ